MSTPEAPERYLYLTMTLNLHSLAIDQALERSHRHHVVTSYVCIMYHRVPMLHELPSI